MERIEYVWINKSTKITGKFKVEAPTLEECDAIAKRKLAEETGAEFVNWYSI